jgi:uncharacterized protein (DUF58 family)
MLGGRYQSAFRGTGVAFEEVREYQPGDEIRSIDWNVTARMGQPFIKRFVEERELTIMLVVDRSPSLWFGSQERTKSQCCIRMSSLLAFAALQNQDRVGLITFGEEVQAYLPPHRGLAHTQLLLRKLLETPSGQGTGLANALHFLLRVQRRRAIVFLLSDFLATGFEQPLFRAAHHHDLIAVPIHDPLERKLPDVGVIHVRDLESRETTWVDTSSTQSRQAYERRAETRADHLRALLHSQGADVMELSTADDPVDVVIRFFQRRSPLQSIRRVGRSRVAHRLS